MDVLRFRYSNAAGEVSEQALRKWKEPGLYIEGICDVSGRFKSFRKDRVLEWHGVAASHLREPYPAPPPRLEKVCSDRWEVLFTGLAAATREELEMQAIDAGLNVRKTVTKNLRILCSGPNAGPTKVAGAKEIGAFILSVEQMVHFIESGEIPFSDEV